MNSVAENLSWTNGGDGNETRLLVNRASERATIIRARLAVVAEELRQAAATDGPHSESLLQLAHKFEQNAKLGDEA